MANTRERNEVVVPPQARAGEPSAAPLRNELRTTPRNEVIPPAPEVTTPAPVNAPPVSHLEAFKADLDKYYRVLFGTPTPPLKTKVRLWASHLGLHCVAAYRLDRYSQSLRRERKVLGYALSVPAIAARMAMEVVHHVGISAEVGPGFFIGHAGNIFIGPTRIGRNFSVTHNVTVGVGHARGERGIPVIGDDVWVGTGSVLAGGIRVGDRATITHGTMLTRDVPEGALAGGNPGRVISQGYDNAKLMGEERVSELRRGKGDGSAT